MDYGKLVSRAWKTTWQYKALWLFAILMNLPSYLVGLSDNYLQQVFSSDTLFLICGFGIVAIFLAFVVSVYQIVGLIRGSYLAAEEAPETITVRDIFRQVHPRYWNMIKFYLVSYAGLIVIAIVFIIFSLVLGKIGESGGLGALLFFSIFCLVFPAMIIFSLVYYQMIIALIVDDLPVMDAFRKGWDVVRKNPGEYFLISLILLVISFGYLGLISIPYFGIMFASMGSFSTPDLIASDQLVSQMPWYLNLLSLILNALGLFLSVFGISVFVNAYLEFTGRPNWKTPRELRESPLDEAGPA